MILPGMGAVGGMLGPALIYAWINWGDANAMTGWAIPAATDIAFALGILALLGNRVPIGLKVLLVSLAIFDDIGAIAIIALFYTSDLSMLALGVVVACLPVLLLLNRRGVTRVAPYVLIGVVMWVALLKSGVHATWTASCWRCSSHAGPEEPGALTRARAGGGPAFDRVPGDPARLRVRERRHPAGGHGRRLHVAPGSAGHRRGLFIGKQVGVMGFAWVALRFGATMPARVTWAVSTGPHCSAAWASR